MLGICTLNACGQITNTTHTMLTHYNTSKPQTIELPKILREVSGIVFSDGIDSVLFAEQDEFGNVYSVNTQNGTSTLFNTIQQKGDFEDIAYNQSVFYLLRSDGTIFSFPKKNIVDKAEIKTFGNLLPAYEYEGLYYHSIDNSLYALTKTIPSDKKNIFIYQLPIQSNGEPILGNKISINIKDVENLVGKKITRFNPSAIAYNPVDQQWFILSSVNHLLLVLDKNWAAIDYTILDAQVYPQPEGMAFDSKGNLWLSSEAKNQAYGKIYKIERR